MERSSLTLLERLLMLSSQLLRLLPDPEPEPLLRSDTLPLLLLSEPRLHLQGSSAYQPFSTCDDHRAKWGVAGVCLAQEGEQAAEEVSYASKRCTRPVPRIGINAASRKLRNED